MNHNLEQCVEEAATETAADTSGEGAGSRILTWLRGSSLERARRDASLRMEQLNERVLIGAELNRLPGNSPASPPLHHALRLMERVLDEGRDAVLGLRSAITASASLEQALVALRDELMPGSGVRFGVLVLGQTTPLQPEVREHLYCIAREAVVNALRHARATSIEAEIVYSPRRLRVIVRDDGCGIDPAILRSPPHTHLGIRSICERARSIGAQLEVWSKPKGGTEVVVSVRRVLENR